MDTLEYQNTQETKVHGHEDFPFNNVLFYFMGNERKNQEAAENAGLLYCRMNRG